jgi:hypothetical protein
MKMSRYTSSASPITESAQRDTRNVTRTVEEGLSGICPLSV